MSARVAPRIGDLVDQYLAERAAQAGIRAMSSTLKRFVASAGERSVTTLRRHHVERWLAEAEGVSPVTVATRLKHIRSWCRWCVKEGHLPSDPTAGLRVAGQPGRRRLRQPRPITDEVADRLLNDYRRDQQRRGLSPRTVAGRRRTLVLLAVHVGPGRLLDATKADIEGWLDSCAIGVRSRHTYLSGARAFYDFCEREGLRSDNPARRIPLPRQGRLLPRPIPTDDLTAALAGADARMRAWLLLGCYQGFRAKEMAGLRAEDVLDDRDPPLLLVSSPKGGRERMLPLHPSVAEALRVHGMPRRGFVFHLDDGRPMRAETVGSYIGNYLHSIGVECSAHQLRHWFGTEVYGGCRDLRVTQELMGHASPQTTAIYAAWSTSDATDVVRSLDVHSP